MSLTLNPPEKHVELSRTIITEPSVLKRLYSLDTLRGFDMFWIMGADHAVDAMAKATRSPFWEAFANQLTHPDWNGFHFYDLIFPLFLFLAGVSTPFSIGRELDKGKARHQLLVRVIKRGLILVILGIIYNNGLQIRPISDIRFPSVLGKIGVGYMFANIIYLYSSERMQMIWFWTLLIGYWLLLKFTSAPGFLQGDLTEPGNFMSYFDRSVLPGKLSRGIHDTVGLLNIITAVSTALSGIIAGNLLKKATIEPSKKAGWLLASGVVLMLLSFVWNLDFPINKNLWSSSFVLLTSGMSLVLLSAFYYFIDVLGYKKWTFFFRVIGMNSILIYMSGRFINWQYTTNAVFKWLGQWIGEPYNIVVLALCTIAIEWFFLYFMYKKKVFLRV